MQPSNLVLLSGQLALSQAMDVVANNVANASTSGFKREGIAFETAMKKAAAILEQQIMGFDYSALSFMKALRHWVRTLFARDTMTLSMLTWR